MKEWKDQMARFLLPNEPRDYVRGWNAAIKTVMQMEEKYTTDKHTEPETFQECKWLSDDFSEICCNSASPCCAEFCQYKPCEREKLCEHFEAVRMYTYEMQLKVFYAEKPTDMMDAWEKLKEDEIIGVRFESLKEL